MKYNYFGKKVLILGIGLTGISCINFFLKQGIVPKLIDESKNPVHLQKIPNNIKYHLGNLNHEWILESDLIVVSPGFSVFREIFLYARFLGIEIINDIELFCREINVPIISITGTNGKSTVATMVLKIAQNAGYNAVLGGNIGIPVLNLVDKKFDLCILELSSFQLEHTFNLKSKISVILNISEDHINRYPNGFKQYKKIKLSIYKKSEICIVNKKSQLKNIINNQKNKKWITFGTKKSNYQVHFDKKNVFLCHNNKKIFNITNIPLLGNHNYHNALVSFAISDAIKIPRNYIINTLKNFVNLPHRLQIIHKKNGINWINDSKSTNVNSTKTALESLKTSGTIRLLLGGDSKSANFTILKNYFKKLKIQIYCFGKDGMKLSKIYEKKSIFVKTLPEAIQLIIKQAIYGDIVLLSPGCSSLDQFSSFEERGNLFIKIVKEIT